MMKLSRSNHGSSGYEFRATIRIQQGPGFSTFLLETTMGSFGSKTGNQTKAASCFITILRLALLLLQVSRCSTFLSRTRGHRSSCRAFSIADDPRAVPHSAASASLSREDVRCGSQWKRGRRPQSSHRRRVSFVSTRCCATTPTDTDENSQQAEQDEEGKNDPLSDVVAKRQEGEDEGKSESDAPPYFVEQRHQEDEDEGESGVVEKRPGAPPVAVHHTAIKTANITNAIQFYGLLGFDVTCRFRAGPARAAWLELGSADDVNGTAQGLKTRLELIEIPGYMLNQGLTSPGSSPGRPRAINLMERQDLLGYNHLALDVTSQIGLRNISIPSQTLGNVSSEGNETQSSRSDAKWNHQHLPVSLSGWISQLNATSVQTFGKSLRVALMPQQQLIGRDVYELAFLYDADGCLVELLNLQGRSLAKDIASGWEPWGGTSFLGSIR